MTAVFVTMDIGFGFVRVFGELLAQLLTPSFSVDIWEFSLDLDKAETVTNVLMILE